MEFMKVDEILNLIGLVMNLLGTIVAGVSAGSFLTSVCAALSATEVTLQTLFSQARGIPLFVNMDKSRDKAFKSMARWTTTGLVLIGLGFLIQVTALPTVVKMEAKAIHHLAKATKSRRNQPD
jgi:hypothetical protein